MSNQYAVAWQTELPTPIVQTLRRAMRRVRTVVLLRGLAAVIAVAVLSLLAVMAVDATVVIFSSTTRWLMTAAAWTLTALAAIWFLARPLARTLSMSGMARIIESHHPEMQERISSAVELLMSSDSPDVRGSEALIGALVGQAAESIRLVQPRREITFRAARPFLVAAACTIGVLALLVAAWPRHTVRLLARAVNPSANLPNVYADQITWTVRASDRDARPHAGGWAVLDDASLPLHIEVERRGVDKVRVLLTGPNGIETAHEAAKSMREDRTFNYTVAPRASNYRLRLHAGDAVTAYTDVTVTPRPAVLSFDVRYDYPAYTALEPVTVTDAEGPIVAVNGTVVTVTAYTNCTAATGLLRTGGTVDVAATGDITSRADGDSCTFTFTLSPEMGALWHVELEDRFGFTNERVRNELVVLPDLPPTVQITYPAADADLTVPPRDTVPIGYTAEDDFGIASLQVEMKTPTAELPPMPVQLPETTSDLRGVIPLELRRLRLGDARSLSFRLAVADTHPDGEGGHVAYSEWRTVKIHRRATSLETQALRARIDSLRERLQEILLRLKAAKELTVSLDDEVRLEGALPEEVSALVDDLLGKLDGAGGLTSDLAIELAGGTFDSFAGRLTTIAETHIGGALGSTLAIKLTEAATRRSEAAQEADFQVDQAIVAVEKLLEDLERAAGEVSREQQVGELADEQERLAQERSAMEQNRQDDNAPAPQMTEEEWRRRQDEIAEAVQQMLEEMLRDTEQGNTARELAAEAQELSERQDQARDDTGLLAERNAHRDELAEILEQQRDLAERTKKLEGADTAAENMEKAAENLAEGKREDTLQSQEWAARSLGDLQQQMKKQPQDEAIAKALQDLAGKQKQLAEKVKAAAEQLAKAREAEDRKAIEAAERSLREAGREQEALSRNRESIERQAREANDAARQAARQPGDRMNEARNEMNRARGEQAAEKAQQAAEELQKAADALSERTPNAEEANRRAEEAKKLADEQWELRNRTRRAFENAERTQAALEQRQENALAEDQEQVAREAIDLAQDVRREQPTDENVERDAARQATQAAREMRSGELEEAAETAQEAAESMEEMAGELEGELGERAQELAQRQASIAERARRQAANEQAEAMETRQEELNRRTDALAEKAGELAESIAGNEEAEQSAQQATEQLAQAQASQEQASGALEAGEAGPARDQQRQAATKLGEAAQSLVGTASRLARQQVSSEAAQQQQPEMSRAAESTAQAAETAQSADAQQAAADLRSAQQAMAQRARESGTQPFSAESMAQRSTQAPQRLEGRVRPEGEGTELGAVGLREAEWGRLRELGTEAMQGGRRDAPPEYRDLIREYYLRLARMQEQQDGARR